MRRLLLVVLPVLFAGVCPAQTQTSPVEIPDKEVVKHWAGVRLNIHGIGAPYPRNAVTLNVIVSPMGLVESAQAISGPKQFYVEAEQLELQRQFIPFELDGHAVRAVIHDHVAVYPPEVWVDPKVPFPEIKNWSSLRVTLERTSCFGGCPVYSVEILGDGRLTFHADTSALIVGTHRGRISKDALARLVGDFRSANYFSLKDNYVAGWSDVPTYKTSIEFDGHKKKVVEEMGVLAGMPEVVGTLEHQIDVEAGTQKWLTETDETWPALLAEKWNFKAQTDENVALFASVVASGSPQLVQDFISAGAPALKLDKTGQGALVSAAGRGNSELVGRMVAGEESLPPDLLFLALRAAARSGDLATVDLLLDKGANVNGKANVEDGDNDDTVLTAAAKSGKADVVEEILRYHPDPRQNGDGDVDVVSAAVENFEKKPGIKEVIADLVAAGADVNARDSQGRTPIFHACDNPDAVKLLAAAGADVNAKDSNGYTPLMMCLTIKSVQALLDAGADPTIKNNQGKNAADWARQNGIMAVSALLDAAIKARQGN
jgi:Domain of unknown function (DUF6438)/Ankyrin repeats (3 copies)